MRSKPKVENLILYRDVAQLGSALRLGRRGRRFESCHPDFKVFAFRDLLRLVFINTLNKILNAYEYPQLILVYKK